MTVSFKKIEEFSKGKVRFYTVLLNENELTEFEYFVNQEQLYDLHQKEMNALFVTLELIKKRGAKSNIFKPEESFHYLPVVANEIKDNNKRDFGVRLYCLRLLDDLLILFNGDIKTAKQALNCPNVKKHFLLAKKITYEIDKALQKREINLNDFDPFISFDLEI